MKRKFVMITKGNNLFCEKSTLVLNQDTHTN